MKNQDKINNVLMPSTKISKLEFEKDTKQPISKHKREFPLDAFPLKIQQIIKEANKAYQIPKDFYGGSILTVCAAAIGRGCDLFYKNYTVPSNIFLAIVGDVSTGKTPAVNFCTQPLKTIDKNLYKKYTTAYKNWDNINAKDKPKCENLIVSDTTTEGVNKALQNTKNGLLVVRDELVGWTKSMNQYKNGGGDQEYWLSAWNGKDGKINRSSDKNETNYVFNIRVSVLGGLQPSVLKYMYLGDKASNGFLARILFVYPSNQKKPKETEIEPNRDILNTYDTIITSLYNVCKIEKEGYEGEKIELSVAAKKEYIKWRNDNTNEINEEIDNEVIKGIFSKMELYCLRIALVLQLLNEICEHDSINFMEIEVNLEQMKNAIKLCKYFKYTGEKVYNRVYHFNPLSKLNSNKLRIYNDLDDGFKRSDIKDILEKFGLSMSSRSISRFLKNPKIFKKLEHNKYKKLC